MFNIFLFALHFLLIPKSSDPSLVKYSFEKPIMGTTFRIVMIHDDPNEAQLAADLAFQKVNDLNDIFTNYQSDSEAMSISTIPQKVSDELWHVLLISKQFYLQSDKAFDVTIGPVSKLWRKAIRRGERPSNEDIIKAKALVGFDFVNIDSATQKVSFQKEDMLFDFGGIVKGYAVDQAYKVLRTNEIQYALVDGGGDLFIGEHPGKGWEIKIQNLKEKLKLTNVALASSGSKYQHLKIEGTTYGHIINPESANGIQSSETINIMGPSCMIADALATTISITSDFDFIKKYFSEYLRI